MTEYLYGRNAVRECLRARRRHIHKLILADGVKPSPIITEITTLARQLSVPIHETPRQRLNNFAGTDNHQGMVLEVGRFPTFDLPDIIAYSQKQPEPALLLALDHIEDPHNVGALLRTANAIGVHGVIIPNRRAVDITPAVVNTSAGASEYHRVAIVANLAQALQTIQQQNIWAIGLEQTPTSQPFHQVDLDRPLVLVIGSEGKGMSQRIRDLCDILLTIPMRGEVESLNASVAGALAMYEAWRARKFSAQ